MQLHGDELLEALVNLEWLLRRETVEQTHKAYLVCEAQAVMIASTRGYLCQIPLGQRAVPDQLPSGVFVMLHRNLSTKNGPLFFLD